MNGFTLHDVQCFDAVLDAGGFEAAARRLHRSHPAVFAAVARLEAQLGLELLDRSGYRVRATPTGRSFHRRAQSLLREVRALEIHAANLAMGEESDLRVVVGDLCPREETLAVLGRFFGRCPGTRLHLLHEAVGGPVERLLDDDADLILHRVDKSDPRVEWVDLCKVRFVPVAAPGFLPFPITRSLTLEALRPFTQCVLRDTARHSPPESFYIIEGAPQCTVSDQLMKKEVIVQGMGWGHVPDFLAAAELGAGRLRSIAGRHLPGRTEELVAARRRDRPHGPIANRLWSYLQTEAPRLRAAVATMGPR